MNCPNCNAENKVDARFCVKCGFHFEPGQATGWVFCTKCGSRQPAERTFCSECGASLPAVLKYTADQAKQITDESADAIPIAAAADASAASAENMQAQYTAEASASMQNPAGNTGKQRGSKGKMLISVLLAAILLLVGGCLIWYFVAPMSAYNALPFLPCPHEWLNATCTEAQTCAVCGKTEGEPLGHKWIAATCEEAEYCERCGEIGAQALGHQWLDATCTEPKTCAICGLQKGNPIAHKMVVVDCESPMVCENCGAVGETVAGHWWQAATFIAPKTCKRCGETIGTVLTYLTDLTPSDHYGKIYYHTAFKLPFKTNSNWRDLDTPGHVDKAMDADGNFYTCGIHLDGDSLGPYWVEYALNGENYKLTGYIAPRNGTDGQNYSKYLEIYGDGVLLYTSEMHYCYTYLMDGWLELEEYSSREYVDIDISGVQTLRIEYPAMSGPNDLCVFYDATIS